MRKKKAFRNHSHLASFLASSFLLEQKRNKKFKAPKEKAKKSAFVGRKKKTRRNIHYKASRDWLKQFFFQRQANKH